MINSPVFKLIKSEVHQERYSIQSKRYDKGSSINSENGTVFERLLFMSDSKEVLYFPVGAAEYVFDRTVELFEVHIYEKSPLTTSFIKAQQSKASPISVTGDACFYNFLARKIKITEPREFYLKKGTDCIWAVSGMITVSAEGQSITVTENQWVVVDTPDMCYSISGQGEFFFLKL